MFEVRGPDHISLPGRPLWLPEETGWDAGGRRRHGTGGQGGCCKWMQVGTAAIRRGTERATRPCNRAW